MRARTLVIGMLAVVGAVLQAAPAVAQDREGPGDDGMSAYSVARLKIFEGSAWVRTPDSGEWEEFYHNSPVPERARISIPEGSEGELQFHGGQFILLTGGSEVDVRRLDEEKSVFRLRAGEVRLSLPKEDFAPLLIHVPGGRSVDFGTPGQYWLTALEEGETRLVVRSGAGVVAAEGGPIEVKGGEEALIGREVKVGPSRDEAGTAYEEPAPLTESEAQAGVPPALAYELRDYGDWVYSPTYGHVWRPQVAPGWSPYYYGRWVWVSPYGWVWVSDEPWGWYPYHYGYWYSDPLFGWCWYPFHSFVSVHFVFGGHRFTHFHGRAFFAPATVRFVRSGRDVRWVPLRPGERTATRVSFTRTDSRLRTWEKRVPDRTVFVRGRGDQAKSWRDWSDASRLSRGRGAAGVSPPRSGREAAPAVRGGEPAGRGGREIISPRAPARSGPGGGTVPRAPGRERRSQDIDRGDQRRGDARELRAPRPGRGEGREGPSPRMERPSGRAQGTGSFNRVESLNREPGAAVRAGPRRAGTAGPSAPRDGSRSWRRGSPRGSVPAALGPSPRAHPGATGSIAGGKRSDAQRAPSFLPRFGGGGDRGSSFSGREGRGGDFRAFSGPGAGGRGGGGRGGGGHGGRR